VNDPKFRMIGNCFFNKSVNGNAPAKDGTRPDGIDILKS